MFCWWNEKWRLHLIFMFALVNYLVGLGLFRGAEHKKRGLRDEAPLESARLDLPASVLDSTQREVTGFHLPTHGRHILLQHVVDAEHQLIAD